MNLHKVIEKIRKPWLRNLKDYEDQTRLISKNNPTIFDVGANVGQTTEKYLHYFDQPLIHAFEPFEEVANIYQEKFANKANVLLNRYALSNKKGVSSFYLNRCNYTNSILPTISQQIPNSPLDLQCTNESKISVTTNTIDTYSKAKKINTIDILKLDTQGSEHLILKGASNHLKKGSVSLIFTEVSFVRLYEHQSMFSDLENLLNQFGYCLYNIYNLVPDPSLRLYSGDAIFTSPNLRNLVNSSKSSASISKLTT